MADETPAAATAAAARPQKPDEAAYNQALAKADKEHKDVMAKFEAVRQKINLATPSKDPNSQSPAQKRRQELISQLQEIRSKQAGGKNSRTSKLDQIKRLDEQMRSRIAEQKTARSKVAFKSTDEIDQKISSLEKQVDGGQMKLVDEKKALAEISNLKKQKKGFAQFDDSQKQIDQLKAQIKDIKDSMDDPEAKAMSEQYNKLQAELDGIKAEQDSAYKNLSGLRDERTKLHAQQQETYQAIRKIKDDFHTQRKAHANYEREAKQRAWERNKAEREKFDREKKKERAQKMLDEASDPAYLEEMRRGNSLIHYYDPLHQVEKKALLADKGLGASDNIRKVDDSQFKGKPLVRKEDKDEDLFAPAKKGKKGGKKENPAAKTGFSCPPSVIDDCTFLQVDPPMSAADVPSLIEKVKAKLKHWQDDQPKQTQRNIDKAKKEIEKLETEEAAAGSGTATPNGANGHADKSVNDVADKVKETKLDDKNEPETATA